MKTNYRLLKFKFILQIAIAIIWPFLFISFLSKGIIAAAIGQELRSLLDGLLGRENGYYLYVELFIYRREQLLLLFCCLLILGSLYYVVNRFIRYFNGIGKGIDDLLSESDQPIALPPDLSDMQLKLNEAKATLIRRKKDAMESEQRKNDLVVYLAHDLKTPLTSVLGYLTLLQEAPDMPEAQRSKYTDIVVRKAERLEELINAFFDITRFNLQNLTISKRLIKLSLMLEQLADEFYPMLSAKQMRASIHCPQNLTVEADPDLLARVLANLLKNAAAYGEKNSLVTIEANSEKDFVRISFINHGQPIRADELAHVFEKFYRLDNARSTQTGGSGLGLAIAKRITTLHGGTLEATSDQSETRFTVTLPAHS